METVEGGDITGVICKQHSTDDCCTQSGGLHLSRLTRLQRREMRNMKRYGMEYSGIHSSSAIGEGTGGKPVLKRHVHDALQRMRSPGDPLKWVSDELATRLMLA